MENCSSVCDLSLLIHELTKAQELTRQLCDHLNQPSDPQLCNSLVQRILSFQDKAISMVKSSSTSGDLDGDLRAGGGHSTGTITDSPHSFSGSPRSDGDSGRAPAFEGVHERREMCKKRKTLPKWTKQVKVNSGTGMEGPLEDGYSWRKYGQKDILGSKFPRGYYRCTHRNTQGCPATKQVQRSDENPTIFDVTYRGDHTCVHLPQPVAAPRGRNQEKIISPAVDFSPQNNNDNQLLLNFKSGLKVKTEGLNDEHESSPFSFPSTPVAAENLPENHIFSAPPTLESSHHHHHNGFPGGGSCFSPSFVSPATSESNYFSVSPCRMSGGGFGVGPSFLQQTTAESGLTEIVSAATSAANSPLASLSDFMLEQEFDTNFDFDDDTFFHDDDSFFPLS